MILIELISMMETMKMIAENPGNISEWGEQIITEN